MRVSNQRVRKQRQVQTGYETESVHVPILRCSLQHGNKTLELSETLLYWYHTRYDQETKHYRDDKGEDAYGRMWPFGVNERYYRFEYLK